MQFIGAGRCNVVVSVPDAAILEPLSVLHANDSDAVLRHHNHHSHHYAVLRVRNAPPCVCSVCYNALSSFAGWSKTIHITADIKADLVRAIPMFYHPLMQDATEAVLIPNFVCDPRCVLHCDAEEESVNCTACDVFTVELKPKAAWRPPRVVGIQVDGQRYFIHPVKRTRCRYSQMLWYKAARDKTHKMTRQSAKNAYCPNYLFDPLLATEEGIQRLAKQSSLESSHHSSNNNMRILCMEENCDPLNQRSLKGMADAWDGSGLAPVLSRLQRYGVGHHVATDQVEVLDIELLYRWATAKDKSSVQWLVSESAVSTSAACQCTADAADWNNKEEAAPSPVYEAIPPLLDYDTCVQRFYASTTAKDVSVIISASIPRSEVPSPSCSAPPTVKTSCHGGVLVDYGFPHGGVYRVGVVDLDEKTHKSLEHYYLHDQRIVKAFAEGEESALALLPRQ